MQHYPDQRLIAKMTSIQREALLPEDAEGVVSIVEGQAVDIRQVIARGNMPSRLVVVNAVAELGSMTDETLRRLLLVKEGVDKVTIGEPIAGKDRKRGRRVMSPIDGFVVGINKGRILMREIPEYINLEAGVRGTVKEVYPGRGARIEATGAILQGVWGNGRRLIAVMRFEPTAGGIEDMPLETLDVTYKGEIVITTRPLTPYILTVAQVRSFGGIIAPSMDARMVEMALGMDIAIMLTEGFGEARMSQAIVGLLQELEGGQMTLDAYSPSRFVPRRPEAIFNRRADDSFAPPEIGQPLKRGMRVRVGRDPYMGYVGRVVDLPDHPMLLDNGLRLMCAKVDFPNGESVQIPLANLELAGR